LETNPVLSSMPTYERELVEKRHNIITMQIELEFAIMDSSVLGMVSGN
jgi:hypothetical protein